MSIQGTPRVDRDSAERLVDGRGAGPVAVLLRAAAAPAHADELAGENAAVAAFRDAAAVAPVPHRSVFRRSVAKALTIKAVLVVAVAGSTGVVLAASEGTLPVPWSNTPADVPGATTTPAPNAPAGHSGDDRQSPATPGPAVVGLCEAYTSGGDKDLDNPAFRALVDAAGGADEVAGYCEVVEKTAPDTPDAPGAPSTTGRPGEPGEDAGEGREPATPPAVTSTRAGRPSERPGVTEPPTKGKPEKPTRTARTTETTETTETEPTSDPDDEVATTETPDSPALGAASAVPPSGAEPPSKGS